MATNHPIKEKNNITKRLKARHYVKECVPSVIILHHYTDVYLLSQETLGLRLLISPQLLNTQWWQISISCIPMSQALSSFKFRIFPALWLDILHGHFHWHLINIHNLYDCMKYHMNEMLLSWSQTYPFLSTKDNGDNSVYIIIKWLSYGSWIISIMWPDSLTLLAFISVSALNLLEMLKMLKEVSCIKCTTQLHNSQLPGLSWWDNHGKNIG